MFLNALMYMSDLLIKHYHKTKILRTNYAYFAVWYKIMMNLPLRQLSKPWLSTEAVLATGLADQVRHFVASLLIVIIKMYTDKLRTHIRVQKIIMQVVLQQDVYYYK